MSHTPGPWTWRPSPHREASLPEDVGEFVGLIAGEGRPHVIGSYDGVAVSYEDAALIAAAPDLLAALQRIADWSLPMEDISQTEYGPIKALARQAIALTQDSPEEGP